MDCMPPPSHHRIGEELSYDLSTCPPLVDSLESPLTPPNPSFHLSADNETRHSFKDDFEVLLPTKLEEVDLGNFKDDKQKDKISANHNQEGSNDGDQSTFASGSINCSPNEFPDQERKESNPRNPFLDQWDSDYGYKDVNSCDDFQHPSPFKIMGGKDDHKTPIQVEARSTLLVGPSKSLFFPTTKRKHVERSKSTLPQRDGDHPTLTKGGLANSFLNLLSHGDNHKESEKKEPPCSEGVPDPDRTERRKSIPIHFSLNSCQPENPPTTPTIRLPDENDEEDPTQLNSDDALTLYLPQNHVVAPHPAGDHGILGHWYHNIFSHHKAKRAAKKKITVHEDIVFFFENAFGGKNGAQTPTVALHNMIFDPHVMEAFLKLPEVKEIKELWHFIEETETSRTSDDILEETLFSINSIMGPDLGGTWGVDSKGRAKGGYNVTLGEVRNHLKAAFQVSPETFETILEKVHRREAANVTLTLSIIEASDLRAKTVKGGSNPYVTIDIPGTGQNYRTTTQHETLNPKWKEEFKLKVKNLNQDIVKLQIWHDFDPKLTSQVLAVKDLASFSRLIKGTTAIAHKHEHHLLGSVTVPLKDIRERGINDWFPIVKDPSREGVKQRGSLLVNAFVTASLKSVSGPDAQRSHDALLARLIYHHIKTATNNNTEEDNVHIPWHGQLSPEANAAIVQHAIILGLKPALQNLSWWIVGSRVPTVDGGWLFNQLKIVQKHLTDVVYDVSAIESLADSYAIWIDNSIQRLRTLNKSFPPQSGIVAKQQFAYTVDIFLALENHKESIDLLERKEIKNLKNEVKDALMVYMKLWWTELLEHHLKGETKKEIEVQSIIDITSAMYDFLCEIQSFYGPILLKQMDIKLFRELYLLATKKLKHCVHPPILNMYNHLENISEQQTEDMDDGKPTYTLQDGTNLWQLYVNLGRINKLGADLPIEIRKESGIYEYHRWFNRGVRRWVDLARKRALQMIERAVELDNLEHVDEYCKFSSSSTDVSGIFTDVKIWWHKLEWPDPENSTILLAKILEDICSYGMRYADLLKKKVEGLFSSQSTADQLVISQQICTGLNNIERVRDELTRLPDAFGVRFLSEKVQMSQTGGQDASTRFTNNIKTLIEHSSENMEGKVIEFIEAVIEKMTVTLHDAVIQSCDASSEKHLLEVVLDPAIQLICNEMSDGNFKRFLQRLWEGLVHLFALTVKRNTDKRKASYFNGVYQILDCCFKFFSPSNGAGIDQTEAKSQAYVDLMKLLECLRLTTENLISRYYSERYEEQKASTNNPKGELVVRALFTKAGKLIAEIIMAKDMHLSGEGGGFVAKHTPQASIDSYVKVQCVPSDWFPNIHEARTKTMKKSDPAVFDETFEFELKKEDNGVSSGFLLFTLKDYNLGRSNTFIGEAMIPLDELECVDSSSVHSIQNTYLKVTQPMQESGYHSLRALALRSGDRTACAFLKKIHLRVNCTKLKVSSPGLSSDEEKPKPKSPRLLRKIMNN